MLVRKATREDVPAIVAMLADDALGATRESPDDLQPYLDAFSVIDADPHQYLAICEENGAVVGTMQLSFIAGLSRRGASRALVEAVRIHHEARGTGLGTRMIEWRLMRHGLVAAR